MRVLVLNRETKEYFTNDGWTTDVLKALDFGRIKNAIAFCHIHVEEHAHVVLADEQGKICGEACQVSAIPTAASLAYRSATFMRDSARAA